MGILDNLRAWAWSFLMPEELTDNAWRQKLSDYATLQQYARGQHPRQLKQKPGQADDNITLNFAGLVINRSVSMLFGKAIKFDAPQGAEREGEYLDAVWRANRQGQLLHRLGLLGAVYGTCYLKLVPDGVEYNGAQYPRLVPLHPAWVSIDTEPEDVDRVLRYTIRYNYRDATGHEVARKQEIERELSTDRDADGAEYATGAVAQWRVRDYEAGRVNGGQWQLVAETAWPYPFPPIVHWQNLPDPEGCYGRSDIVDVLGVQDKANFTASNIGRIIRYHAHPRTWGTGGNLTAGASWGPDEIVFLNGGSPGAQARLENLEMQSDLASSRAFALDLRQALFDISQTVDLSSMADKLGSLTNFGLRVLFMDALAKNDTKRLLYGDGLMEANRRMLLLADLTPVEAPLVWADPLPVSELEQAQALTTDQDAGRVSAQTASELRGYDWETEEERRAATQAAGDNVGAAILRAFETGAQ